MLLRRIFLVFVLALMTFPAMAAADEHKKETSSEESKIDVRQLILEHIGDSYSWHITTIKGHHISIPLPVILRGSNGSWHLFLSSKFDHGHAQYRNFFIAQDGKHKGKIVESGPQATESYVRPLDLSITKNIFSLMINSAILIFIVLFCAKWYRNRKSDRANPKGFVAFVEMFIMSIIDDIIKPCIGKNYARYTPYLLTVFFFIFINNVMGIIPLFPGGANITGNIAVTFILALFSFVIINMYGSKEYWKEIFWPDVPVWLKVPPVIPAIEIIGMIAKPFALMIRLFANILAGHSVVIGLTCIVFLTVGLGSAINAGMTVVAVLMTVFIDCLELLVAYIQAYVFTILSAVFIGLSQVEPHSASSHK